MTYNLTENQKELLRWIVEQVKAGKLQETFNVDYAINRIGTGELPFNLKLLEQGKFDAIAESKLLLVNKTTRFVGDNLRCTLTAQTFRAVDTNFAEDEVKTPVSTIAQPHPPEISLSLDRLREKYPDAKKLGFLIMRFAAEQPYAKIIEAVKQTGEKNGLKIVRADETEFHTDLWGNVRTYLHGCGFGIAVYERILSDEPNANVGLEVGYLMAMNKPVLLLKDKTVEILQTDLAGKLYKQFDPHDPEGTIPDQLTKWLQDYGIIVSEKKSSRENVGLASL